MSDRPEKKRRAKLRPETLASSIVILLAVNVVQRSIGLGRGVLFCKWMSPESLGHWEMAIGFLIMASPVAVLGLPGAFGRYLVRYQQQGQLAMFLRRTATWTFSLAGVAIAGLVLLRAPAAELVFGDAAYSQLLVLVAMTLAAVILHHFLEAVFAGLQLFRVVSAMQFCQSMTFASVSLSLLWFYSPGAESVVIGYGAGCLVSCFGVLSWSLWRGGENVDQASATPHREFWPPLMQFAIGVWIASLLSNLFGIVDRYMIIHFSGLSNEAALEQIGNYHASTLVPVLLVSVANLVVGAITPHLSSDWENDDRTRVGQRLNRLLQIGAAGMMTAGVGVVVLCPGLFRFAFADKYEAGLAALPWATLSCVWFALLLVSETYAWCAEKTRYAAIPLAIGLVANILLNLLWLPRWGLAGAVAATAVATLITLYSQLAVNGRLGMHLQKTTLAMGVAPAMLVVDPSLAAVTATVLIGLVVLRWRYEGGAILPRRFRKGEAISGAAS